MKKLILRGEVICSRPLKLKKVLISPPLPISPPHPTPQGLKHARQGKDLPLNGHHQPKATKFVMAYYSNTRKLIGQMTI